MASPPEHQGGSRRARALGVAARRGPGIARPGRASARREPRGELGVDREPGRQGVPVRLGGRRQTSRAGQARSGFTWSTVTGETPPQSSIPRRAAGPRVVGQVGWGLEMDLGGKHEPGGGDRPQELVGRTRRLAAMAVRGLGRKFWTMTSWTWPWRRVGLGDRPQGGKPVGPGLADPDEDACRERDGQLARPPRGWPAGGRAPCRGRARWAARSGSSDSSIIPWLAVTVRKLRRARREKAPRRWRAGAGRSLRDEPGSTRPGSRPSSVKPCSASQPPRRVTQLGALAEVKSAS